MRSATAPETIVVAVPQNIIWKTKNVSSRAPSSRVAPTNSTGPTQPPRVVPNIKKLGLLTPRVREGFSRLGIIQFEDADPEALDRQIGLA